MRFGTSGTQSRIPLVLPAAVLRTLVELEVAIAVGRPKPVDNFCDNAVLYRSADILRVLGRWFTSVCAFARDGVDVYVSVRAMGTRRDGPRTAVVREAGI